MVTQGSLHSPHFPESTSEYSFSFESFETHQSITWTVKKVRALNIPCTRKLTSIFAIWSL